MLQKLRKRMRGEKGFTLIELLVVIIIIAILAAIAIPTFLGQRQKAQDAAAKSLVRNAMTAIEAYYVDAQTFTAGAAMTAAVHAIEPSITFTAAAADVATSAPTVAPGGELTKNNEVAYFGNDTTYSVATEAASGHYFGVHVDKAAAGNVFVKDLDGSGAGAATLNW
ncbi:MAG: prepilin-type N-terminal cleavage/methylation domain-containing protein [Actinobacteria bacterium]|nr:prepilin-type N-terminal cleavage/methylation domain-containing protein [Actinomycetota bacterium]